MTEILFEVYKWITTAAALTGAYFVTSQKKIGLYFWVFSNSSLTGIAIAYQDWPQAFMFIAYLVITLKGIYCWDKK